MKINWKQKLTSRKFWAAIISLISSVCVFCKVPTGSIEAFGAIIWAAASTVAYIIGEGLVDAASVGTKNETADNDNTKKEI